MVIGGLVVDVVVLVVFLREEEKTVVLKFPSTISLSFSFSCFFSLL
jgi:hypothetical protein